MSETTRYSDSQLEVFKELIISKIDKTENQINQLKQQIDEINENTDGDFGNDWLDDSGTNTDVSMLGRMIQRQEKYLQSLGNALLRVNNKSYGICVVTGKLIPKERLMAVPTTTKSIEAKTGSTTVSKKKKIRGKNSDTPTKETRTKKVVTKIIRKENKSPDEAVEKNKNTNFIEEEDFENDFFDPRLDGLEEFPGEEDEVSNFDD